MHGLPVHCIHNMKSRRRKNNNRPAISSSSTDDRDAVVCLNCGEECTGNYCSACGQSVHTPQRITMKPLWKSVAMSFARLTPGFWTTFVGLIIHPWEVIRQYIHGKRIKYSPPVTMVIQLLLYFTFIYTVLGNIFDIDFISSDELELPQEWGWFINMLLNSDLFGRLIIAGYMALNCYIVYGLATGRRYNFAEYFIAAVYMGCCFSIYSNILRPLDLINHGWTDIAKMLSALIIGTMALNKAFPIKKPLKRWLTWLLFVFMNIAILPLIAFIAAVIIAI